MSNVLEAFKYEFELSVVLLNMHIAHMSKFNETLQFISVHVIAFFVHQIKTDLTIWTIGILLFLYSQIILGSKSI